MCVVVISSSIIVWLHHCFFTNIDDTAVPNILSLSMHTYEYAAVVSLLQCTVIRAHVGHIDIALGAFVAGCTFIKSAAKQFSRASETVL